MRKLILILAAAAAIAGAQSLPNAVPMPTPEIQFVDNHGKPLAGAYLCSFEAGTSTPLATYTDSSAGTPNTNPIVLNVAGRASVWVGPQLYKFILYVGGNGACPGTGAVQWSQDNVSDTTLYFTNYVKTAGTATLITYTAPLTGAVQRTVSDKLADTVSIEDFGAACDGTTDDTAVLATALAHTSNLLIACPIYLATSISIPIGNTVTFQRPGLLNTAAGATVTWAGTFTAPNYQIFTGSGTYVLHNRPAVTNALWFPGSDIGAQINAAAAALGLGCGHIIVPRINNGYSFSTPINLDNTVGCELDGGGGLTGGTPTNNVYWTYTASGSATVLSARSTTGLKLHGISLLATNASFTGKGIDLGHSSAGNDTAQADVYDFNLVSNGGAVFSAGIDLNLAIDTKIRNGFVQGYVVGINGASDASPGYSNSNQVEKVSFESGSSSTYSILNPGEGWLISNNTFENNNAALVPIGCTLSSGDQFRAAGVMITANWFGDWVNDATTSEIEVCGPAWNVTGNFMAGPGGTPTFTEITIADGVAGFSATANEFDIGTGGTNNIVSLGTPSANIMITANKMESAPAAFLVGTCVTGYITDYNGTQLCPAPPTSLVGSFNGTLAPNLPSSVGGTGYFLTGGYSSPVIGAFYIGDGSGYHFVYRTRVGASDTDLGYVTDTGFFNFPVFNATSEFELNGVSGYSGTVTCSAGQHINSITISGGIITAAPTCN